jgi:hypothetical protein
MPVVLDSCLIRTGATVPAAGTGSFGQIVELELEPGLACVNVQLSGFSVEIVDGDADLGATDAGVGTVLYDEKTGKLSFQAFATVDGAGEFRAQVFYTVLALGTSAAKEG